MKEKVATVYKAVGQLASGVWVSSYIESDLQVEYALNKKSYPCHPDLPLFACQNKRMAQIYVPDAFGSNGGNQERRYAERALILKCQAGNPRYLNDHQDIDVLYFVPDPWLTYESARFIMLNMLQRGKNTPVYDGVVLADWILPIKIVKVYDDISKTP